MRTFFKINTLVLIKSSSDLWMLSLTWLIQATTAALDPAATALGMDSRLWESLHEQNKIHIQIERKVKENTTFYSPNNFTICHIFPKDMTIITAPSVTPILKILNSCSSDRKSLWDKCILDAKLQLWGWKFRFLIK